MEKAFAVQLSQDKVGVGGARVSWCPHQQDSLLWVCPGVLHLHGGGGSEDEPIGAEVRYLVLVLSRLLPGLHPKVALHKKLQQQNHQVSPDAGHGLMFGGFGSQNHRCESGSASGSVPTVTSPVQVLSRVPGGLRVCHPFSLLGGEPRGQRSPHRTVQVWSRVNVRHECVGGDVDRANDGSVCGSTERNPVSTLIKVAARVPLEGNACIFMPSQMEVELSRSRPGSSSVPREISGSEPLRSFLPDLCNSGCWV